MITMSSAMMSVLLSFGFRSVIIAALLAGLAGCSALRIGYGTAPDLVYWWVDRYVDFNGAQTPKVREAIRQWFVWHRKTQLPDYAAQLAKAQAEALVDTTPARVCEWQAEVLKRSRTAFERIVPAAAELVLTITPDQVKNVEQRYAKTNDEYRDEYLQPDAKKRAEANLKRTVDRAETLYGSFDEAQRTRIADNLARSPFDPELWFAERRQRQLEALQLLRKLTSEPTTREQAQTALRNYEERLERSPREPYRRYAERLSEFNCSFGAGLHNATTASQRRTAADRLAAWGSDLRAIAAAPVTDPN
jgi:hypothetical protein